MNLKVGIFCFENTCNFIHAFHIDQTACVECQKSLRLAQIPATCEFLKNLHSRHLRNTFLPNTPLEFLNNSRNLIRRHQISFPEPCNISSSTNFFLFRSPSHHRPFSGRRLPSLVPRWPATPPPQLGDPVSPQIEYFRDIKCKCLRSTWFPPDSFTKYVPLLQRTLPSFAGTFWCIFFSATKCKVNPELIQKPFLNVVSELTSNFLILKKCFKLYFKHHYITGGVSFPRRIERCQLTLSFLK